MHYVLVGRRDEKFTVRVAADSKDEVIWFDSLRPGQYRLAALGLSGNVRAISTGSVQRVWASGARVEIKPLESLQLDTMGLPVVDSW
jgi:hypothetical protein